MVPTTGCQTAMSSEMRLGMPTDRPMGHWKAMRLERPKENQRDLHLAAPKVRRTATPRVH